MPKLIVFILVVALTSLLVMGGYSTGRGTASGKLVDVTWEGLFFRTCEVDLQVGQGSSRIERFSSESPVVCEDLIKLNGSNVKIGYSQTRLECVTCGSQDLLTNYQIE